jgi:hypothetical protein
VNPGKGVNRGWQEAPGTGPSGHISPAKKVALSGTFWHYLRGGETRIFSAENDLGLERYDFGAIFWHSLVFAGARALRRSHPSQRC